MDAATPVQPKTEPHAEGGDAAFLRRRRDPVAAELHLPDDRFVPMRVVDLAAAIAADPRTFGAFAREATAFAHALDAVMDQEVTALHRELSVKYACINPDRDTMPGPCTSVDNADEAELEVLRGLSYVFDKASYEKLSDVQIESAVRVANSHGLKVQVDPEGVESLSIWVRGRGEITRRKRTMRHPVKGVEIELEVYKRLAVAARVTGEDALRLKLYREIPVADLEALLPHARVSMSVLDRVQVFGGGAGALSGVAFKIPAVIASGLAGLASLGSALVIGFGGLAVKSFMGWRRNKLSRSARRTQHLYSQHMAANAAVLDAVLVQIEEEEVKEALLAYAAMWATGQDTVEDLSAWVERWLFDLTGQTIRFDGSDALESLTRLGLVENGRPVDKPHVHDSIERLWGFWRSRQTVGYHHERMAESAE
ncbi:MAG: DUF3754 domain-containing protein [Planctomycetota bacterium]